MIKKLLSTMIALTMFLSVFTACDSETAQYKPLGIKFYKVSMVSGPKTLEGYPSPDDAYVCKIDGSTETSITVPSEFKGKPVVAVMSDSFNGTITDITISEGVLYIDQAFFGYKVLVNVVLPDSLKCICASFKQCDSLVSIEIPEGVEIRDQSFSKCENLENVTYKGTVGNISDDSFKNCPKMDGAEADGLTDDEWARLLWNESYGKLVSAGVVGKKLKFDGGGNPVIGKMGNFSGISGKVIWGSMEDDLTPSVMRKSPNDHKEGISAYCCDMFYDVPFANERAECDYLLIYAGFTSRVDKSFYRGGADRVTTTTMVFVIDVAAREIVNIKCIGVDCPNAFTDHTRGYTKVVEAEQYMAGLCS